MPTLKGTEASLSHVQCFLYLVSSSINVSVFHITWSDTFRTDIIYIYCLFAQKIFSFLESHPWSEISSFSKLILVLGKAKSHRVPNLGYRGAESPGSFDFSPKNST